MPANTQNEIRQKKKTYQQSIADFQTTIILKTRE